MEERDFLLAVQLTRGLGLVRKAQIIKEIEENGHQLFMHGLK